MTRIDNMSSRSADNLVWPAGDQGEARPDGWELWRAPAKLNLALRVGRRREDGFHEIESVAAKVTLYDELLLRRRDDGQVRLDCAGLDCPAGQDNLVMRAARLLGGGSGADIRLIKHIPPGAGLGGGSSDAAATLLAINRLWGLNLSAQRLAELAVKLGSDVPLFLNGPAVCVGGRGERVSETRVHAFHAVLFLPDLACHTGRVYAAHDAIAAPAEASVNVERFALPPSQWGDAVCNDLRGAAERICPPLVKAAERLADATGCTVHMTGSGSGLFILADDQAQARRAADGLGDEIRTRCRIISLNPW